MCGIVFSITSDVYCTHSNDFFSDALLASQVRGMHSTGIMQLDKKDDKITTFKLAKNASEFLNEQRAKAFISDVPRMPLTVGHVRHATMGGIKDENAHPFVAMNDQGLKVVGVHNGTLRGWKDKAGGESEDVDSAWAFNVLSEKGPVEAFKSFNGAFAFVWHDEAYPGFVFMARNDDRPLHYFITEDGKTILGASELGMLGWLVEKHGFKRIKGKEQFFYLRPDKIYKFSLKNVGQMTIIDRPAYDPTTTIKKPEPVNIVPTGRSRYDELPFEQRMSAWGPHGMNGYRDRDYYSDEKNTLKMVKDALRRARNQREAPSANDDIPFELVDNAALDTRQEEALARMDQREANRLSDAIEEEIARFQGSSEPLDPSNDKPTIDPWGLIDDPQFVGVPNDRACTTAEIKAARDERIYGRLIGFSGVIWDEDTSETYGEAIIMGLDGKTKTLDCIVRGATAAVAKARYVEARSMPVMTIVGIMPGIQMNEKVYVVSELTKEARQALFAHSKNVRQRRVVH